jgi:hypothetical protein
MVSRSGPVSTRRRSRDLSAASRRRSSCDVSCASATPLEPNFRWVAARTITTAHGRANDDRRETWCGSKGEARSQPSTAAGCRRPVACRVLGPAPGRVPYSWCRRRSRAAFWVRHLVGCRSLCPDSAEPSWSTNARVVAGFPAALDAPCRLTGQVGVLVVGVRERGRRIRGAGLCPDRTVPMGVRAKGRAGGR